MFNLTQEERRVVLFLIGITLAGLGINYCTKKHTPNETVTCLSADIGKVDINKADKELLMGVPGIGEKLARRILEYREQQNGLRQIEELKNVKGVTNYRYEKIKEHLILK